MKKIEIAFIWVGILAIVIIASLVLGLSLFLTLPIYTIISLIIIFRKNIAKIFAAEYTRKDTIKMAVDYFNDFWSRKTEIGEVISWKGIYVKEGYYGDEKIVGINAVRHGSNLRIVGLVGFHPLRMVAIKENVKGEHTDPFKYFSELSPLPTKTTKVLNHPELWKKGKIKSIAKLEEEEENE